jgi:NAD(P)-dependent dehydrogenase (short-subunit alcohol dehydrogenase family)
MLMRMDEKIVLITGANSGLGFATARSLAEAGASIVMVCRNPERGDIARQAIARVATDAEPALLICDLSSQDSIHKLAVEIHARYSRIDVLVNNAGGIFDHRQLSIDGIEKTFATNHLAPFLLTNLLLDLVNAAPAGRIVTVSSESHSASLEFDNLLGERHYNFFGAYNRSKLCNILFTYELTRRLQGTNTTANCLSPGPTVTPFGNNMKGFPALFLKSIKRIPFLIGPVQKGAETLIYVASSPELAGVSGRFFLRCREARSKRITYDTRAASQLWSLSESLCDGPSGTPQCARTTGNFRAKGATASSST